MDCRVKPGNDGEQGHEIRSVARTPPVVPRSSGKLWHDTVKPARSVLEQVPELRLRDAAFLRRGHVHLGKLVSPMPGPTGVDDRPAVGVIARRLALGL